MAQEAGWYADPAGRHEVRYWDGSQWTDNVSDRGVMVIDRPAAPAAPAPVFGPWVFRPYRRGVPFVGDMAITVQGTDVSIAGDVLPEEPYRRSRSIVTWAGLGGLGVWLALVFGMVTVDNRSAGEESNTLFGAVTMLSLLALLGVIIGVAIWSPTYQRRNATPMTVHVPTSSIGEVRPCYDWNVGVLWMLLTSPVLGLIITLARGRRVLQVRFASPLVAADRKPVRTMWIKGRRRTDATDMATAVHFTGLDRS